ncbi:hypothetical protein [Amnibacterium endophyticum]|uniref:Uncharacterized protein n=1 Tax=Amnibacterium endophyticum TaxID=2109337 RepID=A0ABW4LCJ5_9MICO
MTVSLQDVRLRRAHAAFERSASGRVDPVRMALGALRSVVALAVAAAAALRGPDPRHLEPRILR